MLLVLVKIATTVGVVLGLAWLSERVSPRVAGIVAGLPLGVTIILFFLGLEQGPAFAGAASLSALAGMTPVMWVIVAYEALARCPGRCGLYAATLSVPPLYLAGAALIALVPQERWLLLALASGSAFAAWLIFRGQAQAPPVRQVRITSRVLLARAGTAAALVVLITGLAEWLGPTWAGLLSAFPNMLLPLLVIVHVTYGADTARGILRALPTGVGSALAFLICGSFTLERWGTWLGILAALAAAALYLSLLTAVLYRRRRGSSRS